LYFNIGEKPDVRTNKYVFKKKMEKNDWTAEDGYKIMIRSLEFSAKGKIWLGLRPLLGKDNVLNVRIHSAFNSMR